MDADETPKNVDESESSSENSGFSPFNEKESSFKRVSSQDLMNFKTSIEMGDENLFLEYIYSNPRYLINNANGPTILEVESHYNALHIAVKSRQMELCRTILNTIGDPKFLALLYPVGHLFSMRSYCLLDCYLNMLDNKLFESPLHFAFKYGTLEIVQMFISFPQCIKYAIDEDNFIPESDYYVPVLYDMNKLKEPFIGDPYDYHLVANIITSGNPWNDMVTNLVACAFAGPMHLEEANNFSNIWKKRRFTKVDYSPEEVKVLRSITNSDPEKELEQIGRTLAKDLSTGWIEYWEELNAWCDIRTSYGLKILEEHMIKNKTAEKFVPFKKQKVSEEMQSHASAEEYTSLHLLASESPESDILFESQLTCRDIHIYRAIKELDISSDNHPLVFKWKHMVEKKLEP